MKKLGTIAVALVFGLGAACSGDSPQLPGGNSQLEVYVHWDDTGLADKRVEVLELGLEQLTDTNGIASFELPAGTYTLRAYDINMGGPAISHIDLSVTTRPGETTQVEVVDCLPCV